MPNDIPAYGMPSRNRQVLLTTRPQGIPQFEHFTLGTTDIPTAAEGQILVRNIYLSVDPAQRGWASAEANYSQPVPLGGPMRALAVAIVVESRAVGFSPGEFLYGFFGWQDYAAVAPETVLHRATEGLPLDAFASLAGINGITAYLALTRLGRPTEGDTLVVSTAAGSVGSFVGQIGRRLGCRTIGITGDDVKLKRCIEAYGYDAAINYKTDDIDAAIVKAAPDGVNIYYDNTGGPILDTVLRRMAVAGRIVQCGTASIPTWTPMPTGPRNEREIMTRRLVWSGFVIFDHLKIYAEAVGTLAAMWQAGDITYDTDLAEGIEQAPAAITALYAGENRGKKLIFIG
jgi:NADPH-dependent curcumin reductase CurA